MKVVINNCHGGFGLSDDAIIRYNELLGRKVWLIEHDTFNYTTYSLVPPDERVDKDNKSHGWAPKTWHEMTENEKFEYNQAYRSQTFHDRDIARNDPLLIQVVEELGEKANGRFAYLKVVEIPDDVEWQIDEYDGAEWVAEKHRTWS